MKLTMLCKDAGSGQNGCPSVYLTDAGDLVIQGKSLDETDFDQLKNVLPGEGAIRVSADLLTRAAELYLGQAG
jgi:hypothetical protein